MRDLTSSSAKSGGEPSGCCLEVGSVPTVSPSGALIRRRRPVAQPINRSRSYSAALSVFEMKIVLVCLVDAEAKMATKTPVSVPQPVHFPKELDDE